MISVCDYQQPSGVGDAKRHPTLLAERVIWIGARSRERIPEDGARFFEADAMLLEIGYRFPIIPLESHPAILHRSNGNCENGPNEIIAVTLSIRERQRLKKQFGGRRWRKLKGTGYVRFPNGTTRLAELHWYEAHGVGRRKMKIKRVLDKGR